jgi:hypothetical protein
LQPTLFLFIIFFIKVIEKVKNVGDLLHQEYTTDEPLLPKFNYYIDESDPDIVVLRRQDGSFVAAFSAQGATREGIVDAAKEDYWKVIEAKVESLDLRGEGDRQKSA